MPQITHWINGKPWEGTPARTGKVYDPATGEVQSEVAFATAEVVDTAVAAALEAFAAWSETPVTRRQNVMFAYRELVVENRHEIAKLVTAEHGKTTPDALGEVQRGLEVVEFACNIAHMVKGEFSEQVSTGVDTFTMRQPLGVVAGITPFNFPAMVPMWMYPLAIAAGNTFILKPSEKDPSPSMFCAELLKEAGLPPGVFNVVHGDKEAVDRILEHPDIQAVSFVGSTPIARYIYENGTRAGKRVQALGGAKNHMVVLPDADMDLAADAAVSAGYGSAGERCMAISVVVTVGDAADRLIPEVTARIAKLRTGPGSDPGLGDGSAGHSRASRQGRRHDRQGGRGGRRPAGRRPRILARTGSRAASTSPRLCSTRSHRTWRSTSTRSSGRCCRWSGWTTIRTPST